MKLPSDVVSAVAQNGRMYPLASRLEASTGFLDVIRSLHAGHSGTLDGVWGSARALVAAALANHTTSTLLVVCPQPGEVDDFCDDLANFCPLPIERFPAWEASPGEQELVEESFGERIRLLKRLGSGNPPRLIVASMQSLMQPVPDAEMLRLQTRRIAVGDVLELESLSRWLIEQGFHNTNAVELPGEFSFRGGILDLFAADWEEPIRVELFGDEVESIRSFEVATQRSLHSLPTLELTVVDPNLWYSDQFIAHLPPQSWVLAIEPSDLKDEGKNYLQRLEEPQHMHTVDAVLEQLFQRPSVTAESIAAGSLETTCRLPLESVERFSGDIAKVRAELDAFGHDQEVFVLCENDAEVQRLHEVFASAELAHQGRLHFPIGHLRQGFRLVPERIVLVSSGELFHRQDLVRRSRRKLGRIIDSFLDLREGDLVVHLAHGIGRYRGMKLLKTEGAAEEHLELEFHSNTKIFVPSSKIELVQKYVGGTKSKPTLARIGGRSWLKQKEAAEKAVGDLAVEMLEVQAARASRPGITFPADTQWQQEFDASFPYNETPDQLTAISAIKEDMQKARPMDRLLCGDVGFGKTELAIRAAFKAVDAGYQVAVLVPTTVLAEQHLRTFRSRMAEFPYVIKSLSRFSTDREQKTIVESLQSGGIDICIGTHRLAQGDIAFRNLGLVIIDEEQRFGVAVKERLKTLRKIVDVLTMTATPIPRTLHLSLLGVRDISNLETPPADRQAVETRVTRFEAEKIRHAILRELNRGGQVYFVHNKILDIHEVASRLHEIVPEARIEIAHGRMPGDDLEEVMLRFVEGKFDILLATTIIESGLDIANANTIFIDDADRYGLADLHQLRGRVGRYKNRAYCYLLVDPRKHLSPDAKRRLRAIEEFHELGSGFAIAMRDLELRGAGNILGTQQSGHIAAVGYELYCALLEQAVRLQLRLPPKDTVDVHIDLPCEAFLPPGYVPDQRLKIDLYRRLARVAKETELQELADELVDRFGPRPTVVDRLIELAELRIMAHTWKIRSIHREDQYAVFGYSSRRRIDKLVVHTQRRVRVVDDRSAYLTLPEGLEEIDQLLPFLKSVLQPA
jgi:transcription-repair coupling factor (superfamily II helicase)